MYPHQLPNLPNKKTMKLVFATESTKDRAVEALEANDQTADKHETGRKSSSLKYGSHLYQTM